MHYHLQQSHLGPKSGYQRWLGVAFLAIFLILMGKIWVPYFTATANAMAITVLPPSWKESYLNATMPKLDNQQYPNQVVIDTGSLYIKAPIVEGVEPADLLRGVGHDPQSALPGQQGRVILSGHRFWNDRRSPWSTVFFSLDKLKINDKITVMYANTVYHYTVKEQWNVPRDEAHPQLEPTTEPILTIYTCGPNAYSNRNRLGYNAVLDETPIKNDSNKVIDTLRDGVL